MPDELRVTAVVVTFNSARHVEGCLVALLAQDHPLEVVVVDNASTDASVERVETIAARHPGRVTLHRLPTNRGFAGGVNHALAQGTGDAVLLVNPDARLAVDHVRHLAAALAADDALGSVQGTLWRPQKGNQPRRIDSTGHLAYVTRLFGNRDEGRTEPSPGGEVFGVTGAAALHRRAMLDDVAVDGEFLDETLFAYYDDIDLDWRARLRGWKAAHVPAATGVHERAGAAASRSDLVEECNAANRLLVIAKLDDRGSLLRALPLVLVGTVLKLLWLALVRPRVVARVARRLVRGWRPTMRRRRRVKARATVAPAAVVATFEPFGWRAWVRRWWRRTRG